jgi:hypothetical protein
MTKSDIIRQAEAQRAALAVLTTLSVEQQNAVDLLVTGQSDAEVAAAVGVTRQTVNVWRNHHPAFQAALNARRREVWETSVDRLRDLLPRALDCLSEELDGRNGWRVALRLLELAGMDCSGGPDLGRYGVGPTNAEAVIEAEVQARADPVALFRRSEVSEYQRREVVTELATRLES